MKTKLLCAIIVITMLVSVSAVCAHPPPAAFGASTNGFFVSGDANAANPNAINFVPYDGSQSVNWPYVGVVFGNIVAIDIPTDASGLYVLDPTVPAVQNILGPGGGLLNAEVVAPGIIATVTDLVVLTPAESLSPPNYTILYLSTGPDQILEYTYAGPGSGMNLVSTTGLQAPGGGAFTGPLSGLTIDNTYAYITEVDGASNDVYRCPLASLIGGQCTTTLVELIETNSGPPELTDALSFDGSYWAYATDSVLKAEIVANLKGDGISGPTSAVYNANALGGSLLGSLDFGVSMIGGWSTGNNTTYYTTGVPLPGEGEVYAEVYGEVGIAFETNYRSVAWTGVPGDNFTGFMMFNNTGDNLIDVDIMLVPASGDGFFGYATLDKTTNPNFYFLWNATVLPGGAGTNMGWDYFDQVNLDACVYNLTGGSVVNLSLFLQTAANTTVRSELAKIVLEATESTGGAENEYLNVETANMDPVSSGYGPYIGDTSGITTLNTTNCEEASFRYGGTPTGIRGYVLYPNTDCTIIWNATTTGEYTYYPDEVEDVCIRVVEGIKDGPVNVLVYDTSPVNVLLCNMTIVTNAAGVGKYNVSELCCSDPTVNGATWNPDTVWAQITMGWNATNSGTGNVDALRVVRRRS